MCITLRTPAQCRFTVGVMFCIERHVKIIRLISFPLYYCDFKLS